MTPKHRFCGRCTESEGQFITFQQKTAIFQKSPKIRHFFKNVSLTFYPEKKEIIFSSNWLVENAYDINKKKERNTSDVFQQINENEFIYVSNYDPRRKRANNFTLEHFEGNKLKFKIKAKTIRWIERDSIFRLSNYSKRQLNELPFLY